MYTKGEWKVIDYDVTKDWMGVASEDTYIAHVDARNEANAQLIASSPDMYEALKALTSYQEQRDKSTMTGLFYLGDLRKLDQQRIDKALAKAEGK